jgi:hypothetical protein
MLLANGCTVHSRWWHATPPGVSSATEEVRRAGAVFGVQSACNGSGVADIK